MTPVERELVFDLFEGKKRSLKTHFLVFYPSFFRCLFLMLTIEVKFVSFQVKEEIKS